MASGYSNRNRKPVRREEEEEEVKDPEQREQQRQQEKQQRPPAKAPPLDLSALGIYVLRDAWSWGRRLVAFFGWWEVEVVLFSFLFLPRFFKFLLGLVSRKLAHIVTGALPSALPRVVAGDGNPSMLKDWLVEGAIGMLPVQAQGAARKVLEALTASGAAAEKEGVDGATEGW